MHKAQDTDWGRTDRTYNQRPMSQGPQSRETARFVHDRGQLTGGRDVKLGPEDELALVRNAGGHIRAPELHPHQGYRDSHRVCVLTVATMESPARRPGLERDAAKGTAAESPASNGRAREGRHGPGL